MEALTDTSVKTHSTSSNKKAILTKTELNLKKKFPLWNTTECVYLEQVMFIHFPHFSQPVRFMARGHIPERKVWGWTGQRCSWRPLQSMSRGSDWQRRTAWSCQWVWPLVILENMCTLFACLRRRMDTRMTLSKVIIMHNLKDLALIVCKKNKKKHIKFCFVHMREYIGGWESLANPFTVRVSPWDVTTVITLIKSDMRTRHSLGTRVLLW